MKNELLNFGPVLAAHTKLLTSMRNTLDLPNSANFYPVFHTSQIIPFVENDDELFPSRAMHKPDHIEIDGIEEHFIDHIVAAHPCGQGWQ